jgi:hypothetical protein
MRTDLDVQLPLIRLVPGPLQLPLGLPVSLLLSGLGLLSLPGRLLQLGLQRLQLWLEAGHLQLGLLGGLHIAVGMG